MGIFVSRLRARRAVRRGLSKRRRQARRRQGSPAFRSLASALTSTPRMSAETPALLLEDIERRHEEVIAELDTLNARIEAVLRDVMASRSPAAHDLTADPRL